MEQDKASKKAARGINMEPRKIDKWWLTGRMLTSAFWWGLSGAGVGAIWGAAFDNIKTIAMWSAVGAAIFGGLIIGPMTYHRGTSPGAGAFQITVTVIAAIIGAIIWLVR